MSKYTDRDYCAETERIIREREPECLDPAGLAHAIMANCESAFIQIGYDQAVEEAADDD